MKINKILPAAMPKKNPACQTSSNLPTWIIIDILTVRGGYDETSLYAFRRLSSYSKNGTLDGTILSSKILASIYIYI